MAHDDADPSLDELARRAAEGDREALSALVRQIQNPMYRLALRFLGHPDDAQDACQEILIRIVTRLGTFEGRSKFTTWGYTVAVRSLLRTRKRLVESSVQGAEQFAAFLDAGIGEIDTTLEEAEYRLLCDEVRISCTYGMLLCLSRPQRAAYLLADVLGLTDTDGAEILDCTREAFRQRVSRARRTLRQVIDNRCGLIDPANLCHCGRQIASSEAAGILDRGHLPLARHTREEVRVWIEPVAKQLDSVVAIGDLYRFDRFAAPAELWDDLQTGSLNCWPLPDGSGLQGRVQPRPGHGARRRTQARVAGLPAEALRARHRRGARTAGAHAASRAFGEPAGHVAS